MARFSPPPHERVVSVSLTAHPESVTDAVRAIEVQVTRTREGDLRVRYVIEGELARVRMPAARRGRPGDELWQHTCCEAFVRAGGSPAYHEFNFAPSGEWAAYAFERYRKGGPLADKGLDPQLIVQRTAVMLGLDAAIRLDRLSPAHATAPLCAALAAVIEDSDGVLSYWALAHGPGKPDFHDPASFVLQIG